MDDCEKIFIRCSEYQKESLIDALLATEGICPFNEDCPVDNCRECMNEWKIEWEIVKDTTVNNGSIRQ